MSRHYPKLSVPLRKITNTIKEIDQRIEEWVHHYIEQIEKNSYE